MGEVPGEAGVDVASLRLDVYEGRDGWWNPQYDVVVPPQDWEFLATGQAFVTRSVKAAGVFWLAWAPRSRARQETRYQDELAAAIVEYLHFAARHEALAQNIARSRHQGPGP